MLNFWRLDTADDFFLVEVPTFVEAAKVRAYHLELLVRVRTLQYSCLPESDAVLFANFQQYYRKIASFLNPVIDVSTLKPLSRHQFFIAAESRGENWISGLELLMGYDYHIESVNKKLCVTSGIVEIDTLAELLLLPCASQVKWLVDSFSPQYLSALAKQISDRLRGQEALDELQREKDLEAFNNTGAQELEQTGFIFPEVL